MGVRRRPWAREALRFARANLSAGAATAVDWALVAGLVAAGAHYLAAAAAGAAAGAGTDFSLKRHWAFDRAAKRGVSSEGLRYLLVSAASLGWNLAASWLLVSGLGLPSLPGVIAASAAVGAIWNYPLHRLYVFPAPPHPPAPSRGSR